MKTLQQWFDEYGASHQNKTNKAIHYICVPVIFFSIIGLLMSIPNDILANLKLGLPIFLTNWAVPLLILVMIFYLRLSFSMALKMIIFSVVCLYLNFQLSTIVSLWVVSLSIFIAAWIGQFYGHHVEGAKPSFIKDLQFLLIGPAWVMDNIFKK